MQNTILKKLIKHNIQVQREVKNALKKKNKAISNLNYSYVSSYNYEIRQLILKQSKEEILEILKNWKPEPIEKINWFRHLVYDMKKEMRLYHIAYSLIKGRKYEEIENPKQENRLRSRDWDKINEIIKIFKYVEEVLKIK